MTLPTRVLAVDLSLTATGLWCGDPYAPGSVAQRREIAPSARRKGESDLAWNVRRCRTLQMGLATAIEDWQPQVVVVEITTHAHQITTRGRGTALERRERTTRGLEFRAGLGLGRALGWIDAFLMFARMTCPPFVTIEARDAKLRVAGSQAASKGAVAAKLREIWGWDTTGWKESEIDALACAVGYVRTLEYDAKERLLRGLADADTAARPSVSSRPTSLRKRTSSSPAR
jgi:Holliday junction resolvasome RuvABC endonuclease subunit